MLDEVMPTGQPVRAGVLVGVVVALVGALGLIWKLAALQRLALAVMAATGGLVQPTLLSSAIIMVLVGAVLVVSGVPLRVLGLRRRDVPRALALLVVLYAALQLALVVSALAAGDRLVLAQHDAAAAIGGFGAQLFGNCPVEEAVFRGLLFRQLVVHARRRGGVGAIVAATVAAAVIFGLWHIPVRLNAGYRGLDLFATLIVATLGGVLVSYLYVRSGNLLIIVVLHTLFNDPMPLVVSPLPPQWILCGLAIGVIVSIELAARARGASP